jgi:hypothetical protein
MWALTYTLLLSLAALGLIVLKLFGVISLGWLWLLLSFFAGISLAFGLVLFTLYFEERRKYGGKAGKRPNPDN